MAITITGTNEDDVLTGGSSIEAFNGGDGFDFVSYAESDVGVTLSLDPETGGLSSDATGDTYTNVEGVIGSDNHDDIYGDDNDNIIQGGAGSDFIDGGYGYNDVALYEGNAEDYTFENTARSEWTVTNNETGDIDTVEGIEVLTFDDTSAYDYAYAFNLDTESESSTVLSGTDGADTFELTPTSDDGIITVDNFGDDDAVEINGFSYDAAYLYHFASNERSLDMDVDLGLIESGDTTQILLYANSAEEDEIASFDELFAVINLDTASESSTVLSGTDDSDMFEFTASSDDGIATVTDFGAEDSIVVDGQTYDAEYLYQFAANDRNLSADVDLDLIGEGDNQQIVLYADSNDASNAASYDEAFAIIEIEIANGMIA